MRVDHFMSEVLNLRGAAAAVARVPRSLDQERDRHAVREMKAAWEAAWKGLPPCPLVILFPGEQFDVLPADAERLLDLWTGER